MNREEIDKKHYRYSDSYVGARKHTAITLEAVIEELELVLEYINNPVQLEYYIKEHIQELQNIIDNG